eukprot:3128342-Pleurochrysis_carterae.AAC.1
MTRRNEPSRLRVKMHGSPQNCVIKAVALQELRIRLLPKMPALTSTFKCHLQLAHELLTCGLIVLFKAFHLLTVKVDVAEPGLREGLDDVNAFQLKVNERNEREEDADGCRLSSCRE